MPLLLDVGIGLYHAGIRLAALWSPKARAWIQGRKGIWERITAKSDALQGCIWMHCASVGEFEQGRPVLEELKRSHPDTPVLITFFSPSGYEACKDYALATHVDYLPPDSRSNAARFLQLTRPRAVLWVKYEFWPQWLNGIKRKGIRSYLISGIFRPEQAFFQWFGRAHRAMLDGFTHLFVQDERSLELLKSIGITHATMSGDTRFDRVDAIAKASERLPIGHAFHRAMDAPVLIAGSTWPADEALIADALQGLPNAPRLMVVPHEPSPIALHRAQQRMPRPVERWSELEARLSSTSVSTHHEPPDEDPLFARTLLVDRMGLLARLYQHCDIAYVGGGFGDGIHSLLEAAAWGKPVIFGPRHHKFAEAAGLIEAGGGFEVRSADELRGVLARLLSDRQAREAASLAALGYVRDRVGATPRIMAGLGAMPI
ncbi:MAG TPA: glycosyltransferase N-terminal domain-containing protein [Flavobacteriales bacterium]|nr:glycosyltransferase N-terminal domain-containing protein [Flavobacteriales bacterium]